MNKYIFSFDLSPATYYQSFPDRLIKRITMKDQDVVAAWADLFVENDWVHFVYVNVEPDYRSYDQIWFFIDNAFNIDLGANNIYWHKIAPSLTHFLHKVAESHPNKVFAATGSANVILNR